MSRADRAQPSDGDVYIYLVMAAFWHSLFSPLPPASSMSSSSPSPASPSPSHASALTGPASASASTNGSGVASKLGVSVSSAPSVRGGMSAIAELMSGGKEVKYPEKLLKRLGDRIGDVAMGRDPAYLDKHFRATMASFYGKFGEKNFQRSLKDSRKVENLILHFATQAHAHLSATRPAAGVSITPGQQWRIQLDSQVAQFVHIIRDEVAHMRWNARDLIGSSKEQLLSRLDSYLAKLEEPPLGSSSHSHSHSNTHTQTHTTDSGRTRGGSTASSAANANASADASASVGASAAHGHGHGHSHGSASGSGTPGPGNGVGQPSSGTAAASVLTMPVTQLVEHQPLFRVIARLMHVDEPQLLLDLDSVRKECTDAAALADLKHASKNVNLGNVWPGRRTDFGKDDAWKAWKANELDYLSQRIAALCIANPDLLKQRGDEPVPAGAAATSTTSTTTTTTTTATATTDSTAGDQSTAGGTADSSITPDDEFVFIPQHPVRVYRRALELCLNADLDMIASSDDDSGVETTILTPNHVELLSRAAEVWRIRPSYTRLAHLQIVLHLWNQQDGPISIPIDCVAAVASKVEQAMDEQPVDQWMTREREFLRSTFTRVLQITLEEITRLLQDLHHTDPEEVYQWAGFADSIYHHVLEANEEATGLLEARIDDLRDLVQIQAIQVYTSVSTEILAQADPTPGKGDDVVLVQQIYTWLYKRARKLSKQFPEPIIDPRLDLPSLVLEKQVPLFWSDLDRHQVRIVDQALQEQDGIPFDEIFDLYDRLTELRKMFQGFCPDSKWEFNDVRFFQPHIEHWLYHTTAKTSEWVDNAIRVDNFQPIDSLDAYHSSSIDDLFTALHQPLDFIDALHWSDPYTLALFRTSLAKTVSQAVEQYCHRIEDMFKTEIFAASASASAAPTGSQGTSSVSGSRNGIDNQLVAAWMERAKQTLRGEEKVEPFDLQAASCVKLNNIQKARQLLDSLYNKIDADAQARIIAQHSSAVPEEPEGLEEESLAPPTTAPLHPIRGNSMAGTGIGGGNKPKQYIFTVKVVQAEGLLSSSGASTSRMDTYVALMDEGRRRPLGETRTLCETSDPQWKEAFDVPVEEQAMWLTLVVLERKGQGSQGQPCGRTQIKLDPSIFLDLQSHDIWLELDTQGKLLLRISVEAERDDILFYFGRAFRSLKRAESEMVRTIVDKISVYVRHCLSRTTVKNLIKSASHSYSHFPAASSAGLVASTAQLNLGRGMNMFKDMAASAWAATTASTSDSVIPPVASSGVTASGASSSTGAAGGVGGMSGGVGGNDGHAQNNKLVKNTELTDAEIENAISPLLDYLDSVLSTLSESLGPEERTTVLTKVWKQVLGTLQSILLPPLSDEPSDMPQLTHAEVNVVMKWRTFLRNYFLALDDNTNEFNGLPPEVLHNAQFRELDEYETLHDLSTDQLMQQCAKAMQVSLRQQAGVGKLGRSKSVMNQRSLGTIKKRKAQKQLQSDFSNEEVIMRLLRMRPGTHEFLSQQLTMKQQLSKMFSETHTPMRSMRRRGGRGARPNRSAGGPPPAGTNRFPGRPLGGVFGGSSLTPPPPPPPPTTASFDESLSGSGMRGGSPFGAGASPGSSPGRDRAHHHPSTARSGRVAGSRALPLQ